MTLLANTVYFLANMVIAVMLGCMLQTAWERSGTWFRLAASLLAAAAVGALFVVGSYGEGFGVRDLIEVAKSVLLALVLVMMRVRQVDAGLDKHSKQRSRNERCGDDSTLAA